MFDRCTIQIQGPQNWMEVILRREPRGYPHFCLGGSTTAESIERVVAWIDKGTHNGVTHWGKYMCGVNSLTGEKRDYRGRLIRSDEFRFGHPEDSIWVYIPQFVELQFWDMGMWSQAGTQDLQAQITPMLRLFQAGLDGRGVHPRFGGLSQGRSYVSCPIFPGRENSGLSVSWTDDVSVSDF